MPCLCLYPTAMAMSCAIELFALKIEINYARYEQEMTLCFRVMRRATCRKRCCTFMGM